MTYGKVLRNQAKRLRSICSEIHRLERAATSLKTKMEVSKARERVTVLADRLAASEEDALEAIAVFKREFKSYRRKL